MQIFGLRRVLYTAAILSLTAPPVNAKGDVPSPDGDWTHVSTGTSFPANAGGFTRSRIYEYDDSGRDASVGYQFKNDNASLSLTAYVYPKKDGIDCQAEFASVTASIFRYQGSSVTEIGAPSVPWSDRGRSAHYARFAIPEGSMREGTPAAQSDVFLYCPPGDAWLVKYRATWFGSAESFPSVMPVINAIGWGKMLN